MTNIAILLKEYRESKNMTRLVVSKKIGVTQQFYGRIEKGKVGLPPKHFKKTRKVLNIPSLHLYTALIADFKTSMKEYL